MCTYWEDYPIYEQNTENMTISEFKGILLKLSRIKTILKRKTIIFEQKGFIKFGTNMVWPWTFWKNPIENAKYFKNHKNYEKYWNCIEKSFSYSGKSNKFGKPHASDEIKLAHTIRSCSPVVDGSSIQIVFKVNVNYSDANVTLFGFAVLRVCCFHVCCDVIASDGKYEM